MKEKSNNNLINELIDDIKNIEKDIIDTKSRIDKKEIYFNKLIKIYKNII